MSVRMVVITRGVEPLVRQPPSPSSPRPWHAPAGTSEAQIHRQPTSPFAQRGYYITFMRMPTYDLADWKQDRGRHPRRRRQHPAALGRRGVPIQEVPDHLDVQRGPRERPPRLRAGPDRPRPHQGHQGAARLHAVRLRRREPVPAGAPGDAGRSARTASRSARRASAAGATTSARPSPSPSSSCWTTSGRCSASTRTPMG